MSETTPAPAPTPTPVTTRKHGVINQRQQKSVTLAEQVCIAAAKDQYASILETGHEITSAFITQLAGDCATARSGLGQVVENAVARKVATGGKKGTKRTLMRAIRQVQSAARQKYAATQPLILKDYYIGQKISATQDTLEQFATAILGKISPPAGSATAADVLPGITAGKIAALSGAVDAYIAAWSAQATAQSDKEKGRIAVAALVKGIDDRRRIVQFAVDGEWPFDVAANAPIRREFGLPVNRPFIATVKNGEAPAAASVTPPAAVSRKVVTKPRVKAKKTVKAAKPAKKRKK